MIKHQSSGLFKDFSKVEQRLLCQSTTDNDENWKSFYQAEPFEEHQRIEIRRRFRFKTNYLPNHLFHEVPLKETHQTVGS